VNEEKFSESVESVESAEFNSIDFLEKNKILVSTKQLANILEITERRIQQMANENILDRYGRNQFELKSSIKNFYNHTIRKTYTTRKKTLQDLIYEKEFYNVELKKIDYQEKKDELISKEFVSECFITSMVKIRESMLEVPEFVSEKLEGKSSKKIKSILKDEILSRLYEIAKGVVNEVDMDEKGSSRIFQ
jgi:hypothetical protein